MQLWNTLSGKKDELVKPKGRPLQMFVCGPTVYDYSHVGHARTYIAYDAFVRYLRTKNWEVFYLENITNIDDKIIARARENKKNPFELAGNFDHAFREDMKALGIESVDKYAKASDYIRQIEEQVKILLKKGFAYEIPGDGIYYDISKFSNYGKLSHRTALQAEDAVSRIDESVKKRNKGDFALWKFPKSPAKPGFIRNLIGSFVDVDGEPLWRTSLGWGRPGWHIEDTAITDKEFGPQYDIHGGAVELKFPHHEAEIAQQEAASGKSPLVKVWMHTGLLTINGQKMAKSLGNFVTIRDALKEYSPEILRWFFLNYHYRTPVDYAPDAIRQIQTIHGRTRVFLEKLDFIAQKGNKGKGTNEVADAVLESRRKFEEALEDDFNTPLALAASLELPSRFQERAWTLNPSEARMIGDSVLNMLGTLGIEVKTAPVPEKAMKLAAERELSRANKQFAQSDALRKEIRMLGYSIEDTPLGPFVYKE